MSKELWETVCNVSDINKNTGVCALHNGEQVAIFKVGDDETLFAIQNYDPIGEANVLSRGIIGDVNGQLVVASPLYKQQFCLMTGRCLEEDDVELKTYQIRNQEGVVQLRL
jgi:nitrite reductase (NADH) small subunit